MNLNNVLIRHHFTAISVGNGSSPEALATVMLNLTYYGFGLNQNAYLFLQNKGDVVAWWQDIEPQLKQITGENRRVGDFVVYKNFPAEVLSKSDTEYWLPQILMYWGFPASFFTEEIQPREKMKEQPPIKILQLAQSNTPAEIFNSYLAAPARWKQSELEDVIFLSQTFAPDFSKIVFKENLVQLATQLIARGQKVKINTATDVLRLAAGLSNGDVSLKEKVKFISFKKPMRKFLLSTLEDCSNLDEDVARRPEIWKRFLHQLHPGDYNRKFNRVKSAMNQLYRDELETFNAKVEALLKQEDDQVLSLLAERPGDFKRRLIHCLDLFGEKAVAAFTQEKVLTKLTTYQLVSLKTHLLSVNSRVHRCFPPKGNWSKMQLGIPRKVVEQDLKTINVAIDTLLNKRLPAIKVLDERTRHIKLPNNGEVGYTRGTTFQIPNQMKFIRTVSYWKSKSSRGVVWYDNGWNFFNSNWQSLGACCWNSVAFGHSNIHNHKYTSAGAIFSGDPVNSKEMEGRAAQMIDLYPERLREVGVRYAVWNILCYSGIPFSDVEDVFAALQWGEEPQKGKLFEPSRSQIAFPLTGKSLNKYICLIDLQTMEMIYLDANLKANIRSAAVNGGLLQTNLPPFMEYINSLPSVFDLFRNANGNGELSVLYSDAHVKLNNTPAYVFKPENKENKFTPFDINSVLI